MSRVVDRMVWLAVILAAASCVPLLERSDLRNFVKVSKSDFKDFNEQGGAQYQDKTGRPGTYRRTNFDDGQTNKNAKLLDLFSFSLGKGPDSEYDRRITQESEQSASQGEKGLPNFRDILDEILEILDPLDIDIDPIEERLESGHDYDSILYDFAESFIEKGRSNLPGTAKAGQDKLNEHKIAESVVRDKLEEAYMRKLLETSGMSGLNNDKWKTLLRSLGVNLLGNIQKKRSKRVTYDDGYVKELPILRFDLDKAFYISNDHLLESDLKEIYKKKGAECTMVHGYRKTPIMSIARCPWYTGQSNVKTFCENTKLSSKLQHEENEINLLHTPVQDMNGFVYKNLYCAQCNGVKHPVAWSTSLECDDVLPLELSDGRDKVMIMGDYSSKNLGCKKTMRPVLLRMIHECDESEIQQQAGIRRHQSRVGSGSNEDYSPFPLSFSIFMNFGFDGKTHILFTTSPDEQFTTQVCPQGQMYDPVNNMCRNISCEDGYRLDKNTCVRAASYESDTTTNDIASLKDIEETVQVVLTLKNVSYAEILLLTISSVEETLVADLAQQFNISFDRITNLTVSVVNSSASGNNTDKEVIEIHRFTTPKPAGIRHRNMKESHEYHNTKQTLTNAANATNLPAYKVYTGNHSKQEGLDDPQPPANLNISVTSALRKNITGQYQSADTADGPRSAAKASKKDDVVGPSDNLSGSSQSEEPNFDGMWAEYPTVDVRVSFLLKPAHKNKTLTEKSVKSVVQTMSDLISSDSFSITINGTNFKVEQLENPSSVTSMDLFCTRGETSYISDEDFEVIRRYDAEKNENLTLVKINETGQVFKPGEYDLTLTVHGTVGNLTRAQVDSFAFVCNMPKIANAGCSRIILTKSEYTKFDNNSIEFRGQVYNFSEYEYENENDDSVKICTPDWSNVRTVYDKTKWALVCGDDLRKLAIAESWLTFGLGLVSLVFMLSVLTTYFLFEKLRNLPGVNTMNLTISLFLGELVFIASGYAKPHEEWLCSGVGMLLHYLFLASFFWMNVMSYDVYRTFAKKCILTRIRNKKKFVPRYAVYAWGSPLLIVLVCAVLDFSNIPQVRIGYGGQFRSSAPGEDSQTISDKNTSVVSPKSTDHVYSIGCWIQEPVASMAAFGGPMMLILLSNVVMFTRTIICIRASTKMTQTSVRRSSLSHMAGHDDVMLYIRMSTVMGFTWIFGLASSIISAFAGPPSRTICIVLHLFGILFIIFNCSQGLFIFFAFVCNRRVVSLYRCALYKLRNGGDRQRPLSSCSSSNTLSVRLSQTSVSHIT